MDNLAGSHIKGYQLLERIGAGGFGAVYKAHQSTVGREVAMKIILPHYANHPDFIRRFETEAQVIARLEHLHIVPLYDYWRDPDGAYLIMRWLRGGSLKDALSKGRFEIEAVGIVLDQIASALALAHRSNVIHRDLKPANIFLDEDGNAYLGDFGIAKDISVAQGVTEVDAIVGSPDYLAPEQARSEQVTPRTDIYSLGVVLYELLSGEHPFPGQNAVHVLFKHLNEPLPEITTLPDDIADKVNEIIQKATAKNPLHRYADALELASAFHQVTKRSTTSQLRLVETLTRREQEILQLVIAGQSNKQIAAQLFITITTVKWYVRQIFTKLGVRSRVQAIVRARELQLISSNGAAVADAPVIPTEDFFPENPYKGLLAFQAADSQDFFGREKLIEKLIRRMSETSEFARFLAVVGPSGSGKSSLVKAGLIPAVWQGVLPHSEKWYVVEMLPGTHPFDELEVVLTRLAANQSGNLREQLSRDERGLLRAAQLILPDDGSELVLVIDQFEELFTLVHDDQIRLQFLKLLQTTVTDPRSRVRIVVTLRADYYDRPLHYPDFGEMLRSRMETVLPLSTNELERAIMLPAERVGVHFEAGLVAAIIDEIHYQAGALPLLQYALTELFEQRKGRTLTLEAYQAIGRSTGALAKRADEIYLNLEDEGRETIRQMFLRLVTLGEGAEDTRRRAARSELLAIATDSDIMDDIIDTYGEYRLLSFDHDPATREPTVEVAHEAILREWERLRHWLNESREDIRQQRQVAQTADAWHSNQRDTSYLLSGTRLEQAEKWYQSTQLVLTPLEREFMQASVAERTTQQQAESERQVREMRLEQRSRNFLRGLVAIFAVATSIAIALSIFALNQNRVAQAERDNAQANFQHSEAQRLAGEANLLLLQNGNSERIALLSIASMNIEYTPQGNAMLEAAALLPYPLQIYDAGNAIKSVAFAPDGSAFAIATDNAIEIWDIATGQRLQQFDLSTTYLGKTNYSPDGSLLVASGRDEMVHIWDVETGEGVQQLSTPGGIVSSTFSPDGRYIVTTGYDGLVRLWDVETGEEVRQFVGHTSWGYPWVMSAAFSLDGEFFVTAGADRTARLWDAQTGEEIRQFTGHTDWLSGRIGFSRDGQYIVTASYDRTARLWDAQTGEEIRQFTGHLSHVNSAVFSPNAEYVLTGGDDKTARLWDTATGRELRRFAGHQGFVTDVAFAPDGNSVLTASADGSVRLWNIHPQEPAQFIGHVDAVMGVAYSSDGNYVFTGGGTIDHSARLWDAHTGQQLRIFDDYTDFVGEVAFSPDSRFVATSGSMTPARLWDVATGELLRLFENTSESNAVAYSPSGQYIATGNNDGTLRLWDAVSGERLYELNAHLSKVEDLDFSYDSQYLVSASSDGHASLWHVESGELVFTLQFAEPLGSVAFTPDNRYIATGGSDGVIRLWDIQTAQEVRQFYGHDQMVWAVAFSPDGVYLASGSEDNSARLWDVASGQEVARYMGHTGSIWDIAFSPDGRFILTGSVDTTARLWYTDYHELLAVLCSRLPRDFTEDERRQYNIRGDVPTCP